jgi:FkbH-like protein
MSFNDAASIAQKTANLSEMLEFINSAELSGDSSGIPVAFNFLRNFTIEGIEPYIQCHCLSSGLKPKIIFGNYDMVHQEVLDRSSHLYSSSPDIIVPALYLDTYLPEGWRGDWRADDVMISLTGLFAEIAQNTDAVIAVNTFVPPFYSDFGISSVKDLSSCHNEVLKLNQLIRKHVLSKPARFILVDWERFVRLLGANESMDYRFWYMSKAPFKKAFLDLYALELVKIARALKGKSKKCLILDCDNTLWGGVIGEDGLQGIKLDRYSYPGNVFYEFQKGILRLHERGVLIAICSKNNEQEVWDVLEGHTDCLLKREHLAAWRVNWNDKASNIRSLAAELNLGIDSFVFVDDNPVECGLIRDMLPEVTVLQVPEKLYTYPPLLNRDGLFDTLTLSPEDRQRSQMYRHEASRKHEQAKFETLDQYLASLSLSITVHPVKEDEVSRVAQLTQKTNQFNLTTRRYSEAKISALCSDPDWAVMSLSVRDKFGESGLTGVLIARKEGEAGIIDSLLMSCRILGRNIEKAFVLEAFAIMVKSWGVKVWNAEFIPTHKNQQVAEFWPSIGFQKLDGREGYTFYELPFAVPVLEPITYIAIEE